MFNLVSTLNISASNAIQTITGLNCSSLMISLSARETFSSGFQIERKYLSGNVFRIRWVQGDRKGVSIPLAYEDREIFFDIHSPDEPFDLELIPGRLQFEYTLKVYEKELSQAAIDFANALQVPIQLLNGLSPQLIQLLIGIDTMPSADTRNLIQSIEATSATIAADKAAQEATNATTAAAIAAAQLAADTANSGVAAVNTVATQITDEMVINEPFSLPVTAFALQASGLYHAVLDLIKVDGSKGVQMSLIDNEGDEQGFSQLIAKYSGNVQKVAVELTENQKNDSSYPLALLCQGRKLAATGGTPPNSPVGTELQSGFRATLANQTLSIFGPDGTLVDTSDPDIVGAYFRGGDRIYVSTSNGLYGYITYPYESGVTWTEATEADYQLAVNTGLTI